MAGSLKTEGIVLRSMRYGEADRILHLYTPQRGRVSAIAKGVRRAKSRFGGRLEPFFRLQLVLYEGRSDLLTVTSAETLAGHRRLREHGPSLDTAARACDAVARLFDDGDPHEGVYHLLANELALLDAAARRGPAAPTRSPSASSCCSRPASRPSSPPARPAASASTSRASPAPPAAWSAAPARRARSGSTQAAHDFLVAALGRPLADTPEAAAARARPGGARDQRDRRAPRARRLAVACA